MSVSGSGITPEGGYWEIDHGWDVFGADGDKVGDVADVQNNYITVSKGFIFKTDMYIPVSAISNVEHDRVYLNVSKNDIERQGWDRVPDSNETNFDRGVRRGMPTDASMTTDTTMRTRSERVTDRDTIDVPVTEERLNVSKRETERGRVNIHKDVVEQEQTVNVPLREEEVHVRRRAAAGDTLSGDVPANAFEEVDIEIPIRGEEADVNKQAVVRENVEVSKTVRERQQPVSGTVRREEVRVDGAEGVVDDTTTGSSRMTGELKRGKRDEGLLDRGRNTVDDMTDRPI
jgi:uncharacterized protein (TIGR02271 family)